MLRVEQKAVADFQNFVEVDEKPIFSYIYYVSIAQTPKIKAISAFKLVCHIN